MNEYILRKNFNQLKSFIEACLGQSDLVDEEDKKYLTTDRQVLLEMAERLSYLVDQEVIGTALPAFDRWPLPISIENAESKRQEIILEKFQALEHRRYEDYLRDKEEYNVLIGELREELRNRRKIPTEIFAEIENHTKDQLRRQTIKLPWELLPDSSDGRFSEIVNHYRKLEERTLHIKYEIDRLYKVYELNADQIYIGTDEFEGYVVFYFVRSQSAVLECPIHGNAIYVFQKNWKALSQLSKAALLGQHAGNIQRITHNGNWFSRLEWLIKSREGRFSKLENQSAEEQHSPN